MHIELISGNNCAQNDVNLVFDTYWYYIEIAYLSNFILIASKLYLRVQKTELWSFHLCIVGYFHLYTKY